MKNLRLLLFVLISLSFVQCQNTAEEQEETSTKAEAIEEAKREAAAQKLAEEQKTLAKVVTPKMVTMNGTWQAIEDANNTIEIAANRFKSFQKDSLVTDASFAFYNKCKSMGGIIDTTATDFIVVDLSDTESQCYYIDKLEPKKLEMTLTSNGQSFSYKRIKGLRKK